MLPELSIATVDAKNGFWHVVLDDYSSRITKFNSNFGRFCWRRQQKTAPARDCAIKKYGLKADPAKIKAVFEMKSTPDAASVRRQTPHSYFLT